MTLVVSDPHHRSRTISESTDGNTYTRRQIFHFGSDDTVTLPDNTELHLPASALAPGETVIIRISVFSAAPPDAPPPPSSPLTEPGVPLYRRMIREDGRTEFADTIEIAIPFTRSNLTVPESTLALYFYDPLAPGWLRIPTSFVDAERQLVRARLRHFTNFAVFGLQAAGSLSGTIVYPNPFVPYDGSDANGKPYDPGDPLSGILFQNVTASADIEIYTISGRLAATLHSSSTNGTIQWNAKSDDGRELASGIYFAVIHSRTGEKTTRKIMIAR